MFKAGYIRLLALCGLGISLCTAAEMRDPTMPSDYQVKPSEVQKIIGDLQLSGVIIANGDRTAIINGVLVKVGDSIGDKKVKEILPYAVRLQGNEGEITLHIFAQEFKETKK